MTGSGDSSADRKLFDDAMAKVPFTKDPNAALEAIMRDPLETHGNRFMAWLKRRAWGQYRLYAVRDDGTAATQADCKRDLGIDRRRLTNVVAYYEQRGYLRRVGRVLFPVISPQLDPDQGEAPDSSDDYAEFLEYWKVANATDYTEQEVARRILKRLQKVQIVRYKEWRTLRIKTGATLKRVREFMREDSNVPSPSTTTTEPLAPAAVAVVVAEALGEYGPIAAPAAVAFVENCRAQSPDCSAGELIEEIRETAETFSKRVKNPVGVLITSVPATIAAGVKRRRAAQAAIQRDRERAERERNLSLARQIASNASAYDPDDVKWANAFLTAAPA